ncbi:hypothetical protein [Yoonia sp.]|uniref:hypothetical protein n=1 Tax=Yoonia sp. TaxID=2212373 RepID=UPI002FDA9D82
MTTIRIPQTDHGQIRVFATDMTLPQEVLRKTPKGMLALFGAPLNPDFVDIVRIDDLMGMSLTRYIHEGYDMAPDPVDAARVDQITGHAVLVLSRATGGTETRLAPGFGLKHITTYAPGPDVTLPEALSSESARGTIPAAQAKPAKSNARIGGMVAMAALLVMFLLVGLMVLVGG